MNCTRCSGEGFLNMEQVPPDVIAAAEAAGDRPAFMGTIIAWIVKNDGHDVAVCDCCGDGENDWHGEPGEHDPSTFGKRGPYAYNGGLPECY